jgi:hypothetical protein
LSLFSGGLFLVIGQLNHQGSLYREKEKKRMEYKGKQSDLAVPLSLILYIGFKES